MSPRARRTAARAVAAVTAVVRAEAAPCPRCGMPPRVTAWTEPTPGDAPPTIAVRGTYT
ncbi:hypothetical protein G5C65_22170, partial [Streptomyces sp. SB3404]|nr:hypothetical protein [Streptomyces boncukensis]